MQFLSTNWNSCRVLSPYPHTKRSVSSTWGITFSRLFHLQMLVLLLLGGFSWAASTTRKKTNRTTNKSGTRKNGKDFRRGLLVEVCACDPSVDNKTSSECFWICRDALVLSLFLDQTKCGKSKPARFMIIAKYSPKFVNLAMQEDNRNV